MEEKRVSVIIPNYNYADFIIERIDSILSQTYPIYELIILDDASSDNSAEIIKAKISEIKKQKPDLKIKLIVNEKNSGGCVFSQWQKGLKNVTGDFVWIAEADDSADKHFIEVAMQKFDQYQNAVLFYSDSRRIDQNGEIISDTSIDLEDIWHCGRWEKDFYNDGKNENVEYLSANNTIINVSGVVWKNIKELAEIFDEAKEYKIAGDWYIYTRILEYGDIVYSSKPLNYYRKHDKGSASTIIAPTREYAEVLKVQERIEKKYELNESQKKWQKKRRMMMGFVENERNLNKNGRIACLIPDFKEGYGGHRTIFQNMNELIKNGYACDIYVRTIYGDRRPVDIYNDIVKWYGDFGGDIFTGYELAKQYDAVIATSWDTVKPARTLDAKNKLYFIQDYEPWFYSMGEDHLMARETYKYGFKGISIGKWLSEKIQREFGMKVKNFDFCADLDVYKKDENIKKENAICFIFQPDKPRRCVGLGLRALQIVQQKYPDVKIYLFGSPKMEIYNLQAKHLGILGTKECNDLYNRCKVGLCLSATNPSRAPFEMMAAGLPVVEMGLENNLYDLPEDGCLLAEPSPEAIANAIIKILSDDSLAEKLSRGGVKYMKNYPLKKGFGQFVQIVDEIFGKGKYNNPVRTKIYSKEIVKNTECVEELPSEVHFRLTEEVEAEKELLEAQRRDAEWRKNLTIPQRIYLKIRYMLLGR